MKIYRLAAYGLTAVVVLLANGCDKGIEPDPAGPAGSVMPYGLSGTVRFINWPPPDSILDLRVVAFQNYPPQDIVTEVLSGRARYTETLDPYGADSISYRLLLAPIPPGRIPYIVVAQQYGPNIQQNWRLIGVYRSVGDTAQPGAVDVPADSVVPDIDIIADFRLYPDP